MILVIGYGSPLRGDDGVGQRAAEQVAEQASNQDVEVLLRHQLTPELVEPISRAERVLFIDAAENQSAGSIVRRVITPGGAMGAFTHQCTPETLLAGARDLYGSAPRALLYTVGGANFDFSESLSPLVADAMPTLIAQLLAEIAQNQG